MLTLFNLENSRAFRVHWLACELGVPLESRNYARIAGKKADPSMAEDSGYKLGKSPCLIDDDMKIVESSNCMIYLAERYGGQALLPAPPEYSARTRTIGWMDFAETIMTHALAIVYAQWFAPESADAIAEKAAANVQRDLDEIENALAEGPYVCGQAFTAADIALAFSCEYVLVRQVGTKGHPTNWPRIHRWLHIVEARPAYRKALEEGPKFDLCLLDKN